MKKAKKNIGLGSLDTFTDEYELSIMLINLQFSVEKTLPIPVQIKILMSFANSRFLKNLQLIP